MVDSRFRCERAALCLIKESDAGFLHQAADKGLRPRKPRAPRLGAYLGGGVDHQPEQVSSIVIRTRDPELLAAIVAAARLAMATWPSGDVATTYYDNLVDGDAMQAQALACNGLEYNAYNPPGVGTSTPLSATHFRGHHAGCLAVVAPSESANKCPAHCPRNHLGG